MIARNHRFHGRNGIRHVYQGGKIIRGPYCTLKYAPNSRRHAYRLAVVVSKKVSKSAVVRNRIRRRIYEVVRQAVLPAAPYDLIFIVYSEQLALCTSDVLRKAVVGKLRSAHVPLEAAAPPSPDHDIVDNKERS